MKQLLKRRRKQVSDAQQEIYPMPQHRSPSSPKPASPQDKSFSILSSTTPSSGDKHKKNADLDACLSWLQSQTLRQYQHWVAESTEEKEIQLQHVDIETEIGKHKHIIESDIHKDNTYAMQRQQARILALVGLKKDVEQKEFKTKQEQEELWHWQSLMKVLQKQQQPQASVQEHEVNINIANQIKTENTWLNEFISDVSRTILKWKTHAQEAMCIYDEFVDSVSDSVTHQWRWRWSNSSSSSERWKSSWWSGKWKNNRDEDQWILCEVLNLCATLDTYEYSQKSLMKPFLDKNHRTRTSAVDYKQKRDLQKYDLLVKITDATLRMAQALLTSSMKLQLDISQNENEWQQRQTRPGNFRKLNQQTTSLATTVRVSASAPGFSASGLPVLVPTQRVPNSVSAPNLTLNIQALVQQKCTQQQWIENVNENCKASSKMHNSDTPTPSSQNQNEQSLAASIFIQLRQQKQEIQALLLHLMSQTQGQSQTEQQLKYSEPSLNSSKSETESPLMLDSLFTEHAVDEIGSKSGERGSSYWYHFKNHITNSRRKAEQRQTSISNDNDDGIGVDVEPKCEVETASNQSLNKRENQNNNIINEKLTLIGPASRIIWFCNTEASTMVNKLCVNVSKLFSFTDTEELEHKEDTLDDIDNANNNNSDTTDRKYRYTSTCGQIQDITKGNNNKIEKITPDCHTHKHVRERWKHILNLQKLTLLIDLNNATIILARDLMLSLSSSTEKQQQEWEKSGEYINIDVNLNLQTHHKNIHEFESKQNVETIANQNYQLQQKVEAQAQTQTQSESKKVGQLLFSQLQQNRDDMAELQVDLEKLNELRSGNLLEYYMDQIQLPSHEVEKDREEDSQVREQQEKIEEGCQEIMQSWRRDAQVAIRESIKLRLDMLQYCEAHGGNVSTAAHQQFNMVGQQINEAILAIQRQLNST